MLERQKVAIGAEWTAFADNIFGRVVEKVAEWRFYIFKDYRAGLEGDFR